MVKTFEGCCWCFPSACPGQQHQHYIIIFLLATRKIYINFRSTISSLQNGDYSFLDENESKPSRYVVWGKTSSLVRTTSHTIALWHDKQRQQILTHYAPILSEILPDNLSLHLKAYCLWFCYCYRIHYEGRSALAVFSMQLKCSDYVCFFLLTEDTCLRVCLFDDLCICVGAFRLIRLPGRCINYWSLWSYTNSIFSFFWKEWTNF